LELVAGGRVLLDLAVGWLAVVFALLSGLCAGQHCERGRTLPWLAVIAATAGLVTGIAVLVGPSDAPADRLRRIGSVSCAATTTAILMMVGHLT